VLVHRPPLALHVKPGRAEVVALLTALKWFTKDAHPARILTVIKRLSLLSLAALLAVGCSAATTRKDSWDYNGPDTTLKSPPLNMSEERRREISEDLGGKPSGTPSETIQEKYRAEFETWKKNYLEALQVARDTCTRATGDSGTPSFWTGYSDAFVTCMKGRGWTRPRGSNPL
jgi:hypothetical protein